MMPLRLTSEAEGEPDRSGSPDHHSSPEIRRGVSGCGPLGQDSWGESRSESKGSRDSWSVPWIMEKGGSSSRIMHIENLDDALIALERGLEGLDP